MSTNDERALVQRVTNESVLRESDEWLDCRATHAALESAILPPREPQTPLQSHLNVQVRPASCREPLELVLQSLPRANSGTVLDIAHLLFSG